MTTETAIAKKTHWKQNFNIDYLGAYSLDNGKDKVLTIKRLSKEMVKGTGGKEAECLVCFFLEDEKPMILNRTNCKTIAKMFGTPYIEEWAGRKISVYVANVKAFGEDNVEALRVRAIAETDIVDPAELEAATNALTACETVPALQACFVGLSRPLQAATVSVKNDMKALLAADKRPK